MNDALHISVIDETGIKKLAASDECKAMLKKLKDSGVSIDAIVEKFDKMKNKFMSKSISRLNKTRSPCKHNEAPSPRKQKKILDDLYDECDNYIIIETTKLVYSGILSRIDGALLSAYLQKDM
jgi:GTP-binding protein EngB required for normal cell division